MMVKTPKGFTRVFSNDRDEILNDIKTAMVESLKATKDMQSAITALAKQKPDVVKVNNSNPDHSNFYVTGQGIGGTASAFCNIHWTEIK